jgi:hypothetical protein
VALTATIAVQPWRLCTTHVFFGSPRRDGLESRTHLVRPPSSAGPFQEKARKPSRGVPAAQIDCTRLISMESFRT